MKQFMISIIGPNGLNPLDVEAAITRGFEDWRVYFDDRWGNVRVEGVEGAEVPTVVIVEISKENELK